MPDKYILKGHKPIPEPDIVKWAQWFETADRRVAKTDMPNGVWVSTVFLGLDHAWGQGPPLLFETMVFGEDKEERYMDRCSTWEEAEAMHARTVYMMAERYLNEHDGHNSTEESSGGSPESA